MKYHVKKASVVEAVKLLIHTCGRIIQNSTFGSIKPSIMCMLNIKTGGSLFDHLIQNWLALFYEFLFRLIGRVGTPCMWNISRNTYFPPNVPSVLQQISSVLSCPVWPASSLFMDIKYQPDTQTSQSSQFINDKTWKIWSPHTIFCLLCYKGERGYPCFLV
jgi:hypothetical protein